MPEQAEAYVGTAVGAFVVAAQVPAEVVIVPALRAFFAPVGAERSVRNTMVVPGAAVVVWAAVVAVTVVWTTCVTMAVLT